MNQTSAQFSTVSSLLNNINVRVRVGARIHKLRGSPSIAMSGHHDGKLDNLLLVAGEKGPHLCCSSGSSNSHYQNSKAYFLLSISSAADVQHRPDKLTGHGVVIVCSRPQCNLCPNTVALNAYVEAERSAVELLCKRSERRVPRSPRVQRRRLTTPSEIK